MQWEPICSMWTDMYADRRADGRMDGRDETQGHFPQFCERAQKLQFHEHTRLVQPVEPNPHYINPVHIPATHS